MGCLSVYQSGPLAQLDRDSPRVPHFPDSDAFCWVREGPRGIAEIWPPGSRLGASIIFSVLKRRKCRAREVWWPPRVTVRLGQRGPSQAPPTSGLIALPIPLHIQARKVSQLEEKMQLLSPKEAAWHMLVPTVCQLQAWPSIYITAFNLTTAL